jgi:ABC-type Fe3+/spermidine/putrescine transport system ATPase subunit
MSSDIVLAAENLGKSYPLPKGALRVFEGVRFELRKGDLAAIMGPSGVGKTTLLNLLGGLDRPTEGQVILDGEDLFDKTEREVAALRNRKIGFVFQFYHLLPEFTALENVAFPLMIQGLGRAESFARARGILNDVSLEEKAGMRRSRGSPSPGPWSTNRASFSPTSRRGTSTVRRARWSSASSSTSTSGRVYPRSSSPTTKRSPATATSSI